MGEGIRHFIESETDERIPEGLDIDRAYRFTLIFNQSLASDLSEDQALRAAQEGIKTPEDREKLMEGA